MFTVKLRRNSRVKFAGELMDESVNTTPMSQGSMNITECVDENGRRTRYIVSQHSDGFTCLQILTEEDLLRREQHEARRTAAPRDD